MEATPCASYCLFYYLTQRSRATVAAQTCVAPARPYGSVAPATRVRSLTGAEFDKAYMRAMYEHRNLIDRLRTRSSRTPMTRA